MVKDDNYNFKPIEMRDTERTQKLKEEQLGNVMKLDKHVSIIFYKMNSFMEMFPEYFKENLN